eukprot:184840-Chlamydomonas_euryale.AAC.1
MAGQVWGCGVGRVRGCVGKGRWHCVATTVVMLAKRGGGGVPVRANSLSSTLSAPCRPSQRHQEDGSGAGTQHSPHGTTSTLPHTRGTIHTLPLDFLVCLRHRVTQVTQAVGRSSQRHRVTQVESSGSLKSHRQWAVRVKGIGSLESHRHGPLKLRAAGHSSHTGNGPLD